MELLVIYTHARKDKNMCFKGNADSFGSLAKLFHWVMAVLIIGVLLVGLSLEEFENTPDFRTIITYHKEFGILVIALAVLRLGWKVLDISPSLPDTMSDKAKKAAKLGHCALYFLMFALPISGLMASSAAGYPVSMFGWFDLPMLLEQNKELSHDIKEFHELMANALIGLLVLHIGAALVHHFYYKDDILKKMLPKCFKKAILLDGKI